MNWEKKQKTFHRFEIISCISSIIKNPKMTNLTLRWSYLELWGVERWRWTPSCPCGTVPPRRRFWRSRCRSCTGAHTGSGAGGRTGTSCCWQRTGNRCRPVKQQSYVNKGHCTVEHALTKQTSQSRASLNKGPSYNGAFLHKKTTQSGASLYKQHCITRTLSFFF